MNNSILDLRSEILLPDCDIVNVLRKAHIIAHHLKLNEFDKWIQLELIGYSGTNDIPSYRHLKGELKARSESIDGMPVIIPKGKIEKDLNEHNITLSVSQIIDLCSKKINISMSLSGKEQSQLNEICGRKYPNLLEFYVVFPYNSIVEIIEMIKNNLLEWILKLEDAGIAGNNMQFSDEETKAAKNIPQASIVYNIETLQFISGNKNNVSYNNYSFKEDIENIEKAINESNISPDKKEFAFQNLNIVKSNNSSHQTRKNILACLKEFFVNTSANVVADLIGILLVKLGQ